MGPTARPTSLIERPESKSVEGEVHRHMKTIQRLVVEVDETSNTASHHRAIDVCVGEVEEPIEASLKHLLRFESLEIVVSRWARQEK